MQWMTIIIPASVTILGFIVNYLITKKDFQNKIDEYKNSRVYDLKLAAIREAMNFIDSYLSWHTMSSNVTPIREDTTAIALTVQARKCYNSLCATCQSAKIVNLFLKIIFHESQNVFELYNEFRQAARSELGLKNDLTFDENKVFISCISTEDIDKHEQHN